MKQTDSKSPQNIISLKEFKEQPHFVQVPVIVLKDNKLSISARLLYIHLLSYCWFTDFWSPSQKRLARDMGVCDRQIRYLMTELVDNGYMIIHRTGYQSVNTYELKVLPKNKKYRERYVDVFEDEKTGND